VSGFWLKLKDKYPALNKHRSQWLGRGIKYPVLNKNTLWRRLLWKYKIIANNGKFVSQ